MATYNDLKTDQYYLIKETADSVVNLVYVLMETKSSLFLEIEDGTESLIWKKKTDPIKEIVEELTDEQAELYESIVYDEEDDFEWGNEGDDGVIPIHN